MKSLKRVVSSVGPMRGFIADELQGPFREAVLGGPNETVQMPGVDKPVNKDQNVDLSNMIPDMTGGFHWMRREWEEMAAQIESQKEVIAERLERTHSA